MQTEEAQYNLYGLFPLIEGVGRTKADGKPARDVRLSRNTNPSVESRKGAVLLG